MGRYSFPTHPILSDVGSTDGNVLELEAADEVVARNSDAF
jgi:hypothetical protein